MANAVLWVLAGIRFGASLGLIPYAILFSVLLALSVIDLELYLLPNRITYPSILASLVAIPFLSFADLDDPGAAHLGRGVRRPSGFAGFLLVILLAWELIMRKEGMGMGDVKLAILLGLWIGWINPLLTLFALIFSSVLGLVAGVIILAIRKESRAVPVRPVAGPGLHPGHLLLRPDPAAYDIGEAAETALRPPASTSFPVVAGQ